MYEQINYNLEAPYLVRKEYFLTLGYEGPLCRDSV